MTYRQPILASGFVAGAGFLTAISTHADDFPPPPPDKGEDCSGGTTVSARVNAVQSTAQQIDQTATEAQQAIAQTCQ